ncbi:MAG: sialate O-acetylesterase [Tannerella sp.]|jgi:sialate O-acetylesterase|nr:sialate O-acetylesterase [Tannerella sp.]
MKRIITALAVVLLTVRTGMAEVKLPALVADGMVLQREQPIVLWGTADPGEDINIRFLGKTYRTKTAGDGKWETTLPAQKAGGPHTITVNHIELKNVLIGDVWLCSGQSNMETPIPRIMMKYGDEIRSYTNTAIRYVKIPTAWNFHGPQDDTPPAPWLELTPDNAMLYSGVPYFFAREMYDYTGVPVGIINASVGGTPIEAWVSEESILPYPAYMNDKRICESDEFIATMQRFAGIPGRRWAQVMLQQDEGYRGALRWDAPEYDDGEWPSADMFDGSWARNGVRPVVGSIWLRKYIDVPAEQAGQKATLYMGRIVDGDSMFINGRFAGTTSYQYPPRMYDLPAGMLKAGRNLLAIRITTGGAPAQFVKDKPYKFVFDDKSEIKVEGTFKYRTGVIMPYPPMGGLSLTGKPTGLYNGMIAPLRKHAVKGVVWYQGESNDSRHYEYYDMLTSLVRDWRGLWQQELPFLLVQLPNYMEPAPYQDRSNWAELRDVQLKAFRTIPRTGLAVTIDIGEWNDIHPLNKKDVGKRLALQARKIVYGDSKIVAAGPLCKSGAVDDHKIVITFEEGTDDLMPVDELAGFAVAGTDGVFKLARAAIDGRRVIVWHDEVPQPVKVRYAWANNPEGANLGNKSGLPASPFQLTIND